jgi:hypothetical protein
MAITPRIAYVYGGAIALACAPVTLALLIFSILAMNGKCSRWQVRQSVANLTIPGRKFKFFCFRTKTRIFVQLLLISLAASTLNSIGEALGRIPAYPKGDLTALTFCIVISQINKFTYCIAKLSLFRFVYLRGKSLYARGAPGAQVFKWAAYISACAALSCFLASTLVSHPTIDSEMNCNEIHNHNLFFSWIALNWLTCGILGVFFFRPLFESFKTAHSDTKKIISKVAVENLIVGVIMLIITPSLQIIFQYYALLGEPTQTNTFAVIASSFDVAISCVVQFYSSRKIWKRVNPQFGDGSSRERILTPDQDKPMLELASMTKSGGTLPEQSRNGSKEDLLLQSHSSGMELQRALSDEEKADKQQSLEPVQEEKSQGSSSDHLSE